jgi:hypothetical protein
MKAQFAILALSAIGVPAIAHAQEQVATAAQRAEICRHAIVAVTDQTPAPDRRNALSYLSSCGAEGGVALATELRRGRELSDSAALLESYYSVARIVDTSVLKAALDLAADPDASDESRIVSFKILITYKNPALVSLPVSGFLPGHPPALATQDHFGTHKGADLPVGWETTAVKLLERLSDDHLENAAIRHAARRALSYFKI